jgi:hypothetical protein
MEKIEKGSRKKAQKAQKSEARIPAEKTALRCHSPFCASLRPILLLYPCLSVKSVVKALLFKLRHGIVGGERCPPLC